MSSFGVSNIRKMGSKSRRGKDDQSAGAPFLCTQAERGGVVHHGEEKTLGRLYRAFQCLRGAYMRAVDGLFKRACSDTKRVVALN